MSPSSCQALCYWATHCNTNTLQRTAAHSATYGNAFGALFCSTWAWENLERRPPCRLVRGHPKSWTCLSVLQCVVVCCSALQCVAVCCSVLQCVAECCTVLHCVAVCCSALGGADFDIIPTNKITPVKALQRNVLQAPTCLLLLAW